MTLCPNVSATTNVKTLDNRRAEQPAKGARDRFFWEHQLHIKGKTSSRIRNGTVNQWKFHPNEVTSTNKH